MAQKTILPQDLSAVSKTLFIALYARVLESQRPDGLIHDPQALALYNQIDCDWDRLRMEEHDQAATALRLRQFDRYTRQFLAEHPDGVVVHIGCGLDTRFDRMDNGQVEWYDLDLPPVIELRQKLLEEKPRYHMLAASALDPAWMDAVAAHAGRPFLFLAEGVLVYLAEAEVRRLVLACLERFPGAELACDGMTPFMIWMHNVRLASTKADFRLSWGLRHPRDLETWHPGIRLLDVWLYGGQPEPRLGWMRWMHWVPPLNRGVFIARYGLGQA